MKHIQAIATPVGLSERVVIPGCSLVSNFSLHWLGREHVENAKVDFQRPASLKFVKTYLDAFERAQQIAEPAQEGCGLRNWRGVRFVICVYASRRRRGHLRF